MTFDKTPSSQTTQRSDISLLILDIQDMISLLDTELQNPHGDQSSLNTTLFNMTQTIDKFAKFMKSNELSDHQGILSTINHT